MKINCHIHSKIYHPKYFLGKLTPFVDKNTHKIIKVLSSINPFSDKDILNRYADFLEYENSTDEELLNLMIKNEPDTIFCIKIMDLSCMGAGTVKRDILHQFGELLRLKKQGYPILLFPMIDPRNENLDLIYNVFKVHINDIQGFSFYPNVGYTLLDKRLDRFFRLIAHKDKSCIIHCTDTTPVFYQGKDLDSLLKPLQNYSFYRKSNNIKIKCSNFAHPFFTNERAKEYQSINFSHAHLGGENKLWRLYVQKGIEHFENIYADISYTYINNKEIVDDILENEKIANKILYGTDWYMSVTEKNQNIYKNAPDLLKNAKKFLFIKD